VPKTKEAKKKIVRWELMAPGGGRSFTTRREKRKIEFRGTGSKKKYKKIGIIGSEEGNNGTWRVLRYFHRRNKGQEAENYKSEAWSAN